MILLQWQLHNIQIFQSDVLHTLNLYNIFCQISSIKKKKESVVEFHWDYLNLSYLHQLRLTMSSKIVHIPWGGNKAIFASYLFWTQILATMKSQTLFWCLNAETPLQSRFSRV